MSSTAATVARPLRFSRRDWRALGWLMAAYLAVRVLGVLVVQAAINAPHDIPAKGSIGEPEAMPSLLDKLGAWDGGWYAKIATDGYPDHLSLSDPSDDSTAGLAFPPLYPMLMRLLHLLGMSPVAAGVLITGLAGLAAVAGVYAVAREVVSPRASAIVVLLWSVGPMTIVLAMAYSEALFIALAAWAIWVARRGWWLGAGVLALLSGLTRSNGIAVGVAVAVAAAISLCGARKTRRGLGEDSVRWRPAAGAIVGLCGVPLWWLYVAIVSGRIDGWFAMQDFFWGSRFDFGRSVAENIWHTFAFDTGSEPFTRVILAASALAMLAAVALVAAMVIEAWRTRDRAADWWPLAAYGLVLVGLSVGSAGFTQSKVRFLVPMFVLLLLPAKWLAGASRTAIAGLVIVLALASAWFGALMLTVWPYAI